jgi:dTDP-4-dehydrorhamnose reductase
MKILVTGANGFLGRHLIPQLIKAGHDVVGASRSGVSETDGHQSYESQKLDFTDPLNVRDVFEKIKPAIVIHAGAMTKVDECEGQQGLAYKTNVEGTLNILRNAETQRSFLVFISTDFVFKGDKGNYNETDAREPVNFYGSTKREAEDVVMAYKGDWTIIRTSLVYGQATENKPNIVSVVRDKLLKNEYYNVVADQFRTPTYVEDLASGICLVVKNRATGIFNISGGEILSPHEIAIIIASHLHRDPSLIQQVTAENFSQPAKRPANTSLDIRKARKELSYEPRSFRESLERIFS